MRTAVTISAALHVILGVALAVSNRDAMATRADDPVVVEIASAEDLIAATKKDEPLLDLKTTLDAKSETKTKSADSAAEPAPRPFEKPAEKASDKSQDKTQDKPTKAESRPAAVKSEKTAQTKPDDKPQPQAKAEVKPRVEASAAPVPPPPEPQQAQAEPPQSPLSDPQQWGSWLDTAYSAMAATAAAGLDTAEQSARLAPDEVAAFKARLAECWRPPAGLGSNLKVVLRVTFKKNGALAEEPNLLAATASPDGAALMKTAMHALQQCAPYAFLPPAKYKEWRMLDLAFSPNGLTALPRI